VAYTLTKGDQMPQTDVLTGMLGALNSGITLGLANTILTFGGIILNLNIQNGA
jgi:hypothetical protein